MKIIGIGTDIVDLERLEQVMQRRPESFSKRICSAEELALAALSGRTASVTFFAGRWAAKEAAAKALGCGIGEKCSFTDIEIINTSSGKPKMHFSGNAARYFESLGGKEIHLSISHEKNYAVATVLLCGD